MASILKVDSIGKTSGSTQDTMAGLAKAWVNFDGTATDAAARDTFNVSSMADRGTGLATITLTSAMSNSNYAGTTSCMGTNGDDDGRNYIAVAMPKDADEVYVNQFTTSGSAADAGYVAAQIMGDLA
tara:strand:+ start:1075 stop:1455 length:381 start_codon:yes stop_codon:yes gene_type:complete